MPVVRNHKSTRGISFLLFSHFFKSIHVPVPNAKRDLFINREARPGKTHVTRRMILWDVLSFAHSSLYKFFGSSQVNIDVYIFVMRLTVPARRWVAWLTLATTWILIHILWRKKRWIRWKCLHYTQYAPSLCISIFPSPRFLSIPLFNVAYFIYFLTTIKSINYYFRSYIKNIANINIFKQWIACLKNWYSHFKNKLSMFLFIFK